MAAVSPGEATADQTSPNVIVILADDLGYGNVPDDRVIDGKDIWPLLAGKPDAKSPHDAIYYLKGRGVDAIRVGNWKYRIAADKPPKEKKSSRQPAADSKPKRINIETLYNLSDGIGEQTNVIGSHPEIARRLKERLAAFETDPRRNTRPAGVASE